MHDTHNRAHLYFTNSMALQLLPHILSIPQVVCSLDISLKGAIQACVRRLKLTGGSTWHKQDDQVGIFLLHPPQELLTLMSKTMSRTAF